MLPKQLAAKLTFTHDIDDKVINVFVWQVKDAVKVTRSCNVLAQKDIRTHERIVM